jgi:hypothetical protein
MLNTIVKLSASIFLSFLLLARAPGSKDHSTAEADVLSVESPEFAQYFYGRAKERGLEVALVGETKIRYMPADVEQVHLVLREAAADFLPTGRSVQQPRELQVVFEQQLKEAGVPFRKVLHNGEAWTVWEESDADRVRAIKDKVEINYVHDHCCENESVQP